MNPKEYAEKLYFDFQKEISKDPEALASALLCLKYISYESDSRFINFWNEVQIELEAIKNKNNYLL